MTGRLLTMRDPDARQVVGVRELGPRSDVPGPRSDVPGPRSDVVVLARGAVLAILAILALAGCTGVRAGDELARDIAEHQASLLNKDLGHRNRVRDAEYIAATEIPEDVRDGGGTVQLTPVGWSGQVIRSEKATVDVRFVVTVAEAGPAGIGSRGNSAGQVTRCYRYVLQLYRYTEYHEIDCPRRADPVAPSASPVQKLPDDAQERLSTALRTATPATLAGRVRAAFPETYVSVDTITHEGALVAAVGVPAERDCLLLVRTAGGAISSPAYDRIQLEPGEMGCSVGLYVSPPR